MINIRKIVPNLRWERNNRYIYAGLLYLDVPNGILASSRSILLIEPLIALLTDGEARFIQWLPQDYGLMAAYFAPTINSWCRLRLNGVNQGMGNYLLYYSLASKSISQISERAAQLKPGSVLAAEDEAIAADIIASALVK